MQRERELSELIDALLKIKAEMSSPTDVVTEFDKKISEKFDIIEGTQTKILQEIDTIKTMIYDPDEGLFSRIRTTESKHLDKIHHIDKNLSDLKNQQENTVHSNDDIYKSLIHDVDDLKKWKSSWNKLLWVLVIPSVGTGILKVLFDFFTMHVQIK